MTDSLCADKNLDKEILKETESGKTDNIKVYGPYKRKDGRKHVVKYDGKNKVTQSYPRYLMEQHLGRELLPEETVDHIDEDFTNDDLSNLRLISLKDNNIRSVHRRDISRKYNCVWCGNEISITKWQYRGASSKRSGPFCSRTCSGKYGAALQNGRINKLSSSIEKEYCKIDLDGTKTFLGKNSYRIKKDK